nr:hypothetical protein [uncultured Rhodopila sp.]
MRKVIPATCGRVAGLATFFLIGCASAPDGYSKPEITTVTPGQSLIAMYSVDWADDAGNKRTDIGIVVYDGQEIFVENPLLEQSSGEKSGYRSIVLQNPGDRKCLEQENPPPRKSGPVSGKFKMCANILGRDKDEFLLQQTSYLGNVWMSHAVRIRFGLNYCQIKLVSAKRNFRNRPDTVSHAAETTSQRCIYFNRTKPIDIFK